MVDPELNFLKPFRSWSSKVDETLFLATQGDTL